MAIESVFLGELKIVSSGRTNAGLCCQLLVVLMKEAHERHY